MTEGGREGKKIKGQIAGNKKRKGRHRVQQYSANVPEMYYNMKRMRGEKERAETEGEESDRSAFKVPLWK